MTEGKEYDSTAERTAERTAKRTAERTGWGNFFWGESSPPANILVIGEPHSSNLVAQSPKSKLYLKPTTTNGITNNKNVTCARGNNTNSSQEE